MKDKQYIDEENEESKLYYKEMLEAYRRFAEIMFYGKTYEETINDTTNNN